MGSTLRELNESWVKEMKVAFECAGPKLLCAIANSKPIPGNSGYESLKHMLHKKLEDNKCLHDEEDSAQMLHSAVIEVIEASSDFIKHRQGK